LHVGDLAQLAWFCAAPLAGNCSAVDTQMSGLDLLCEMCNRRMCMPAIVISGRLDAQLIQATKEQGAFRCFQKPFDPGTLLAAIHAALVDAYGGDQNPALSG
jgi:FixJ family two-component response regulator